MPILLSWSSGKDSAWSLHVLRQDPRFEVVGLFTTINASAQRVAMHAVRKQLLEIQAERAGLPIEILELPFPCTNADYEGIMGDFVARIKGRGIRHIAFGDLFLEDIRDYRLKNLAGTGIEAHFPLWGIPTDQLSREMIAGGLSAILTSVDPRQIDASFIGRRYDTELLDELPVNADPCGENGEFHSFVTAGPMFSSAIEVTLGEKLERDGFWYADVLPA